MGEGIQMARPTGSALKDRSGLIPVKIALRPRPENSAATNRANVHPACPNPSPSSQSAAGLAVRARDGPCQCLCHRACGHVRHGGHGRSARGVAAGVHGPQGGLPGLPRQRLIGHLAGTLCEVLRRRVDKRSGGQVGVRSLARTGRCRGADHGPFRCCAGPVAGTAVPRCATTPGAHFGPHRLPSPDAMTRPLASRSRPGYRAEQPCGSSFATGRAS